jgi:glycosyltransferase involved in cell wall biosynthesis
VSNASPLFSVLIPSYNRPELIGAAVASVLANDFNDFEIVISDDKSPRQSEIAAVLQPFLADPRVHLHLQPQNLREAANRAFLFQQAKGEWHIVLCDDDKLYPHALATLAQAIRQHPGADLYTFGYSVIDEHDRLSQTRSAPRPLRISPDDTALVRELVVFDTFPFWYFHPATFCSRHDVRTRIQPNPHVGIGDDLIFLIDYVNANGAIQVVPEVLLYYRKMSTASTVQQNQSSGIMPNLVTRAKILLHLQSRQDLRPLLAGYVATAEFRRRLLYDSVLWSEVTAEALVAQVPLPETIVLELSRHLNTGPRGLRRRSLAWRRAAYFVSLFRWSGLCELLRLVYQRLRHA